MFVYEEPSTIFKHVGKKGKELAVLVVLIGAAASWFFSFCLYGFGKLIIKMSEPSESAKKIEEYMRLAAENKEEEHKGKVPKIFLDNRRKLPYNLFVKEKGFL